MAQPMTTLVVFFVALNLFAAMLMGTGVAAMLGIGANVGESQAVDDRVNDRNVSGGTGTGETLTNLRNAVANQFASLIGVVFPGLEMLRRAGVPVYIINFLGGVFSIMSTIAVIRFFREGTL